MLKLNKVHQMDCLKGLKLIEDNSIDLIITSPPYNKAGLHKIKKQIHYGKSRKWIGFELFDEYIDMTNKRLQHAKTYNTYNYTTNTVKHPQNA